MTDVLFMSVFPVMVIAAGIGDFFTMRIPNWLNIAIAVAVVPMALLAGMPFDLFKWHLLAGTVMLAVGFALFAGNVIGGGDAKLLAAAALWIGWPQLVAFAVITALAGGVLAIVMKAWQMVRIEHEVKGVAWFKQIMRSDLDLPYGLAIAAGAVAAYPQTWWMKTLG